MGRCGRVSRRVSLPGGLEMLGQAVLAFQAIAPQDAVLLWLKTIGVPLGRRWGETSHGAPSALPGDPLPLLAPARSRRRQVG